jgi:hypothetical protein
MVRRTPAWTRWTRLEMVDEGRSAPLWAWLMTTRCAGGSYLAVAEQYWSVERPCDRDVP